MCATCGVSRCVARGCTRVCLCDVFEARARASGVRVRAWCLPSAFATRHVCVRGELAVCARCPCVWRLRVSPQGCGRKDGQRAEDGGRSSQNCNWSLALVGKERRKPGTWGQRVWVSDGAKAAPEL